MKLYGQTEAAAELGVSIRTLQRWANRLDIEGVRDGGGRLVKVNASELRQLREAIRYRVGNPNFGKKTT